jgi:hypothetical protein
LAQHNGFGLDIFANNTKAGKRLSFPFFEVRGLFLLFNKEGEAEEERKSGIPTITKKANKPVEVNARFSYLLLSLRSSSSP